MQITCDFAAGNKSDGLTAAAAGCFVSSGRKGVKHGVGRKSVKADCSKHARRKRMTLVID